ncbi:hypothetical protein C0995_004507 [Termitomyces sp. Mi166|nr:hypothetical protein C0995_004507 [Termitomyces sp. Mi166\
MSPVFHRIPQNLFGTCKRFLLRLTSSASKAPTAAGATLRRMIPIRDVYSSLIPSDNNDEDMRILLDNEDEDSVPFSGGCEATKSKIFMRIPSSIPVCHPQPIRNYGKICPDLHTLDFDLNPNSQQAQSQDISPSPISEPESDFSSETASLYTCFSSLPSDIDTINERETSPAPTLATFRSLPANWAPGQPLPDFATNHVREVAPGSETCMTVLAPPPPRRPLGELRQVHRNCGKDSLS